jgi:hypothetical protein
MSVVSFAALTRIVAAGAVAAAGTMLIAAAPTQAEPAPPAPGRDQPGPGAEGTWIEVSPSTVQAGEPVEIKASCKEKVDEAKAHSKAFGEVVLVPQRGFLTGEAFVPADTRAGDYEVKLVCVKSGHAETKLHVIADSRPTHGPHTGGGGLAGSGGSGGDGSDGSLAVAGGLAAVTAGTGLAVALRRRRRLA